MRPLAKLIVVAGHSRGVGKTATVERILRARNREAWTAVKVSAHRHCQPGESRPIIEPDLTPDARTQTGRYLLAGANRAFLCRAPDAQLSAVADFVEQQRASGTNVIVESNRLVEWLAPDLVLFAVAPWIEDWKPSSGAALARTNAFVIRSEGDDPQEVVRALASRGRTGFVIDGDAEARRFETWLDRRLSPAPGKAVALQEHDSYVLVS
jgi:hypothetical protein